MDVNEKRMKATERMRKWRADNYEHCKQSEHNLYLKNKEKYKDYYEKKYSTLEGKAAYLLAGYKANDKKYDRGECTLSVDDVICFLNQKCSYCGETDWHKLGVDRIDDSKPHTIENCVCCCGKCNTNKHIDSLKKTICQYTLDGEFVAEYNSLRDAERMTNIYHSNIGKCCSGKYKTAGGFVWKLK